MPPENFELEMVILITRHGHRSPIRNFPAPYEFKSCDAKNSYDSKIFHEFKRHFLQRRHRLRLAPNFNRISILPEISDCKTSMLSGAGIAQMIKLGKKLRDRFEKYGFQFKNAALKDVQIWSTPYSRTLQSCLL